MDHVEHITSAGRPLAYIIRAELAPVATTFITPPEFKQQVGLVVYPQGGEIARHSHVPVERQLDTVLLEVKQGPYVGQAEKVLF